MLPIVLIALFALELTLCVAIGWHLFGSSVMLRLGELTVCIVLYLVGVRLVFVLLSFAVAHRIDPTRPPLAANAWLRMVAREYGATVLAFSMLIPLAVCFAPRWKPPRGASSTASHDGGVVVLLVHGLLSNRGVWWWFARQLRRAGLNAIDSLDLRPLFGDLDGLADQVHARVQQLAAQGARQVVLVGHSMGGLACRACLARHGAGPVRQLITIASPHAGSRCAHWLPGANMAQMRPGSAWLASLPPSPPVPTLAFYTAHDNLVLPQGSGALPGVAGAQSQPWQGLGHLSPLFDRRVLQRVVQAIRAT
jgi:triacylglycerol lipase